MNFIWRGSDGVCGGSYGFNVSQPCSGPVSWTKAKDICESAGARLCTEHELLTDETKGTGCSLDKKKVWSSTPCGAKDGSAFLVQMGSSNVSLRLPRPNP